MPAQKIRNKLYRYCAYQERCHKEVKEKLYSLNVKGEDADELITHLIHEGFLNEERFSKAFVSGKFRQKNWGRFKIIRELEKRELSGYCITAGLSQIQEEDYLGTLKKILLKKIQHNAVYNVYELRKKVADYGIQKGFEPELVWNEVKLLLP